MTVHLRDIAVGLHRLAAVPAERARWASVILAEVSFLAFPDEFDSDPRGELLREALWDSAFGEPLSAAAAQAAAELSQTQSALGAE